MRLAERLCFFTLTLALFLPLPGCSGVLKTPWFQPPAGIGSAEWTIKAENRKPGTPDWQITNPAFNHQIEGYASLTSVNRGGKIQIFVSTSEPNYQMQFYRLGWYGGAGGREVAPPVVRSGIRQPMPTPDPVTGLIECKWSDPYTLEIPNSTDPTDWASGIYLVKLTGGATRKQSYVIFVVRDDARASDLLFQSSVTTYEAYNDWGGRSLYSNPRAYKVSFNRPYDRFVGAGDLFSWEYNMLRFLEREGYDVTYSSDIDTHLNGQLLLNHNAFLSVGHDEYWTWQMRDNVERARDSGVSLGFFGADTSYWQIRLAPSAATSQPNRTIICYKDASIDPMATVPTMSTRITVPFRTKQIKRPEEEMVGVMYHSWIASGKPSADIVISDASNWIFENTGLRNGDHLRGLLGYETDRMFDHAPEGTVRVAHSMFVDDAGKTLSSDMTVYFTPAKSIVVATGSMDWNWGLDGFALGHPVLTNKAAQQITRNILHRFGATDPAKISIPQPFK